jgi:hypothetical protein
MVERYPKLTVVPFSSFPHSTAVPNAAEPEAEKVSTNAPLGTPVAVKTSELKFDDCPAVLNFDICVRLQQAFKKQQSHEKRLHCPVGVDMLMSILLKYHSEMRGGPSGSSNTSSSSSHVTSVSSVSGVAAAAANAIVEPLAELSVGGSDSGKPAAAQSSAETAADSDSTESDEDDDDDNDDDEDDDDEDQLLRLSSLQGQSKTASSSVRQQAARKLDGGASHSESRSADAVKSSQAAASSAAASAASSLTKARSWWEYEQGVEDTATVAPTVDGGDEDDTELAGESETVENESNRLVVGALNIPRASVFS